MFPFCEISRKVLRSKYIQLTFKGRKVPVDPKTIGEHLKLRRVELHLTHLEVCRILGISTVAISRWELGKSYPSLGKHERIIQFLGYDPFPKFLNNTPDTDEGNEPGFGAFFFNKDPAGFGQEFKRCRLNRWWTMWKCAKELGVDRRSIQNWETGAFLPIKGHRERVVRFLCGP
jgi:transcriptional regulator with XRE-family HTH domain